ERQGNRGDREAALRTLTERDDEHAGVRVGSSATVRRSGRARAARLSDGTRAARRAGCAGSAVVAGACSGDERGPEEQIPGETTSLETVHAFLVLDVRQRR